MTREEAIKALKEMIEYEWDTYKTKTAKVYVEALDMAIEALEQISHLKGRPCEVCEYHTENGCSEWECVFKGV